MVTLRGGGCCCWPELMVSPAGLEVQGRLLRRVGERSSPLRDRNGRRGVTGSASRNSSGAGRRRRPRKGGADGGPRRQGGAPSPRPARLWRDGRCPRTRATALNSQLLHQPSFDGGAGRTIQHGCGGGRDHRTQDAGERAGNARLRARPRPGRNHPVRRGSRRAGPRPRPLPAEPRVARSDRAWGPAAGLRVVSSLGCSGPKITAWGDEGARLRHEAAGPSFTHVQLCEAWVRAQAPSPEWLVSFLGRGLRGSTPRRDPDSERRGPVRRAAVPLAVPGRSRRCLGLRSCPDSSPGRRAASRPHPALGRRELAAGCCYTKQTH